MWRKAYKHVHKITINSLAVNQNVLNKKHYYRIIQHFLRKLLSFLHDIIQNIPSLPQNTDSSDVEVSSPPSPAPSTKSKGKAPLPPATDAMPQHEIKVTTDIFFYNYIRISTSNKNFSN